MLKNRKTNVLSDNDRESQEHVLQIHTYLLYVLLENIDQKLLGEYARRNLDERVGTLQVYNIAN